MLRVLDDTDEVARAQLLFMEKLAKKADKTGKISVGYQGGNQCCTVSWSKNLGMWWVNKPISNRFWNGFGTEKLRWNSGYSHILDCEINPPFQGINRRIAGVFAIDETGELFLLHRGKIGGGRKGIGKDLFLKNYRGKLITVKDGDRLTSLALVGSFESPRFVDQVAIFVNEIKRIKSNVSKNPRTSLSATNDSMPAFNEEFSGTRKPSNIGNQIAAKCDHGIIVNALAKKFESEGITIANSSQIDLFTIGLSNDPKTLFEIKTDTTTTNIFEAIGQLYYYSTNLGGNYSLVAVFPNTLEQNSKEILDKLNIRCLTYEWINDKPHFNQFNAASYI